MLTDKEKKSLIESLLFISGEPLTIVDIKNVLEMSDSEIRQIIDELITEYKTQERGIRIIEVSNGYQMVTSPDNFQWIKKLRNTGTTVKLSVPALETLAIIAYKQPIIKAEIEQIRGANSDGIIKSLLEKRLIKIIGKKDIPGKPLLYGTTQEFLQYFGLKDLTDLPTLKELAREEAL